MTNALTRAKASEQATALMDALIAGYLGPDRTVRDQCDNALHACGKAIVGYLQQVAGSDQTSSLHRQQIADLVNRISSYPPNVANRGQAVQDALLECLRLNRPALHELAYQAIACIPVMAEDLVSLAVAPPRRLEAPAAVTSNVSLGPNATTTAITPMAQFCSAGFGWLF